ncbi:Tumor susceptibility gene 101 protein [Trichuris trichiura]|uniref:Tumor susceptibility gene 101 protein n=1 Tax=Trichuris trichiura TaxID=36087 RepID=A0A077ZB37_TRITR|nr:Tumor susceptibility gene 101 protein [Trichuris trichiura]
MDIVFPRQLRAMWQHCDFICLAAQTGSSSRSNSSLGSLSAKRHLRMASVLLFIGYAQLTAALGWSFVLQKSSEPVYVLTNSSLSNNYTQGNLTITTDRRVIPESVKKMPLTQSPTTFDQAISARTENASLIIDDILNQVVHSSMTDMLSKLSDSLKVVLQKLKSHPNFDSVAGDDKTKLDQLLETAGPLRLIKHGENVSPTSSADSMTKESIGQLVSLLHILENRASTPRTTAEPAISRITQQQQQQKPVSDDATVRMFPNITNATRAAKVIEVPVGVAFEQPPIRRRPVMMAPFLEPTVPPAVASSISSRPAEKSVVVEFMPAIKKPSERFLRLHADVPEQVTTSMFSSVPLPLATPSPRLRTLIKEMGRPRDVDQSKQSSTQFLLETLFIAVGVVFGLLAIASILLVFIAYRRSKRKMQDHRWRTAALTYPKLRSLSDPSQASGESLRELAMSPCIGDGENVPSGGTTDREVETFVAFAHSMPRSIGQTLRHDHAASAEQWWKPYP